MDETDDVEGTGEAEGIDVKVSALKPWFTGSRYLMNFNFICFVKLWISIDGMDSKITWRKLDLVANMS